MSYKQTVFILFILASILVNIYFILKILGYVAPEEKNYKFIAYIKNTLLYIKECFITLYETFWDVIEYIAKQVFSIKNLYYNTGRYFLLFMNKVQYWKVFGIILISLTFMPKIIFLLCIILDVFIFHRLDYTFIFIPILLLPLIPTIIIFALKHYYDEFSASIYFKLQKHYTNDGVCLYSYKQQFQNNPPPGAKSFEDYFYNHYVVISNLYDSLTAYETLLKVTKANHILLILALFRFFTYLFILWYGVVFLPT